MQTKQRNLFEQDLADVMSRDAAMERGMLLEVDATTWVRIDRRGVVELHKSVMPEGVSTREVRISPLPLLPVSVKTLRDDFYVEVLYGTRHGAVRVDTVLLDAVIRPDQHKRTIKDLEGSGFVLNEDTWQDLAKTLRAVMRTRLADGSLTPLPLSPMHWEARENFLVPRKQPMFLIKSNKTVAPGGSTQAKTFPVLRPV